LHDGEVVQVDLGLVTLVDLEHSLGALLDLLVILDEGLQINFLGLGAVAELAEETFHEVLLLLALVDSSFLELA